MAEYGLSSGPFGVGEARSAREIGFEELRAGGLEAGISGSGGWGVYPALYAPFSPPARRWGSYRALGPLSPRSGAGGGAARFFFDPVCEDEPRHFLDSCSLCKKPLGNRDIFMYRGDMPFCSEECRQERIDMDEAREKNWSVSMKASTSMTEQQKQKGKSSQDIRARTAGTVVAG